MTRPLPVPEFRSAAEMLAHYARVNARLGVGGVPAPTVRRPPEVSPPAPMAVVPPPPEPPQPPAPPRPAPIALPSPCPPVPVPALPSEPVEYAGLAAASVHRRRLMAEAAAPYGLSIADLQGPARDAATVRARRDALAAVVEAYPDLSLPQLGRLFEQDHTTILHSLRALGLRPPAVAGGGEADPDPDAPPPASQNRRSAP